MAATPILKTVATSGGGVPALVDAIWGFRAHAPRTQAARQRSARSEYRLRELVSQRFMDHIEGQVLACGELGAIVARIAAREVDPYSAADELVARGRGSIHSRHCEPRRHERHEGHEGHQVLFVSLRVLRVFVIMMAFVISNLWSDRDDARAIDMKAVLDHIGIAVKDLEAALTFYRDALGLEVEASEEVGSQRVRAHFVSVGASSLELLEATAPDSPIARYLAKRGPGLHHITLRVDDLGAALAQLKARGVRLIDEQPRPGAEGALVAFIHPSSAHGVLVELKQSAGVGTTARGTAPGTLHPAQHQAPSTQHPAPSTRPAHFPCSTSPSATSS